MTGVFAHGVASGDPLADGVVIWTRVSGAGTDPVRVRWWVRDAGGETVANGFATAEAEADWTVHVDVAGLEAGTSYRYGFAARGEESPTGRTRTLPADGVEGVRFAQVSCAKFNAGHLNAYACIAAREDLDFVLHLGDYIYEASQTPPASQTQSLDIGRPFDPEHECKTLADYRRRYAQYHERPTQAMHAAHPMIATIDDHELADGAWRDGASEHVEVRDGPWSQRRAWALQARREWLPVRLPDPADPERVHRSVRFGDLAELFLIDTRSRRDEPLPPPEMSRPERSALGAEQREWLFDGLRNSTARWQLLGNPSVMARTWNDDIDRRVRDALVKLKLMDADGEGPDYDQWDGYPAERSALLGFLRDEGLAGNVVVLSGDVHVCLAFELSVQDGDDPVAVEFVNPSLTSQNLDDKLGWEPRTQSIELEQALVAGLPQLHWCDFDSHGYCVVDVTRERVEVEWWSLDTVLEASTAESRAARFAVRHGTPRLVPA